MGTFRTEQIPKSYETLSINSKFPKFLHLMDLWQHRWKHDIIIYVT